MRKWIKQALSLLAATSLLAPIGTTNVKAETDWAAVYQEITAKSQKIYPMHIDGSLDFAVKNYIAGAYQFAGEYNLEPAFSAQGSVDGQVKVEPALVDGEEQNPVPLNLKATIVDGVLYGFDGTSWIAEDFKRFEEEFREQFDQAMTESQDQITRMDAEKLLAFTQKYMDMTETDTDYVFTWKQDVDPEAFYQDLGTIIDVEALKEEAVNQAIERSEAVSEQDSSQLSEEERQAVVDEFSTYFEKGVKWAVRAIDSYEVHYDKTTYYQKAMTLNLKVDHELAMEIMTEFGQAQLVPADFDAFLHITFSFSNVGEQFDIQKPAEAPEPTANSDEMSAEEVSVDEATANEVSGQDITPK